MVREPTREELEALTGFLTKLYFQSKESTFKISNEVVMDFAGRANSRVTFDEARNTFSIIVEPRECH